MTEHRGEPGPLDDSDAQILTELREVYRRLDPVPATLVDDIKYSMTVRLLEAEVAELMRMPAAQVRSESGDRFDSISFSGSRLSLMVSVSAEAAAADTTDDPGVRIDCWVSVGGAVVQVRTSGEAPDVERSQVCDENGRCVFTQVARGPAHFIVWPTAQKDSAPTMTPTIDL